MLGQRDGKIQNQPLRSSQYSHAGYTFLLLAFPIAPCLRLYLTGCYPFCPCMETVQMPSPFYPVRQEAGFAGALAMPGQVPLPEEPGPLRLGMIQHGPGDSGTSANCGAPCPQASPVPPAPTGRPSLLQWCTRDLPACIAVIPLSLIDLGTLVFSSQIDRSLHKGRSQVRSWISFGFPATS